MIHVIAPYPKMKEIAESLAPSFSVPISCVVGDLGAGLELAREALSEDAIIVSRGGTAKLIRETLGIEVIEIGISHSDLLRILKPYIGSTKPVAVVGFRSLTGQAESFCHALGIPSVTLSVDYNAEVPGRVEKLRNMDLACLIGDMVALRTAANLNIPLAFIESGVDAIREALEKAQVISKALAMRKESDLRLGTVLNSVRDAIVAVDKSGTITHINKTARKLLGSGARVGANSAEIIPGQDISRALADRAGASGTLIETQGFRAAMDVTPIVAGNTVQGAVAVLQDVEKIQDMEKKVRKQLHAKGLFAKYRFSDIESKSPAMKEAIGMAREYAKSSGSILIYGETGTGKERLAQGIHNASGVQDGPFVAINCGALPPTLLESELFGYEEGAFTGALRGGKAGLFELAHGGTIFLDEINELDVQLQGKLLRVLQEREVMRVGGLKVTPVSFRLIAASNLPLKTEIARGAFRDDLYYRVSVLDIRIPPLREHVEDIEPLFDSFVRQACGRDCETLPPAPPREFFAGLGRHAWPGNIRELENIAEKWTVLVRLHGLERACALALDSLGTAAGGTDRVARGTQVQGGTQVQNSTLDEIVAKVIRDTLQAEDGNISRAARRLGIDRQTLRKRMNSPSPGRPRA